tara:strand:+ start:24445 stop:24975 length:531 start_codon:yes stop_codon:yes gene_type:complete
MKSLILSVAVFLGISLSQAATVSENAVGLYQGEEHIEEQPTGRVCYLYVDYIEANPLGRHCYNLTTRPVFSTDRDSHPKDEIVVQGHVTNYHRPEYPAIKTCAMSLDGKASGNDIYGNDSTNLYNQIFSWESSHGGYRFNFFVTFSPATKLPSRTRFHRMNWMSEKDYDCVNLQRL